MKRPLIFILIFSIFAVCSVEAQRKRSSSKNKQKSSKATKKNKKLNVAIVVDERLSILLSKPSLYSTPIQRMSRGRTVYILGTKAGDGVTFYKVATTLSKRTTGWVQAEAVVGNFRRNDDQRLAKLVYASSGFSQVQRAAFFLKYFPKSPLRPSILLLLGDLIEEKTLELSKKAARKFDRREMAASGAPLHSFYLSYSSLDRYRRLGIRFLFNLNTKSYHYNGDAWFEIIRKFPKTDEAEEAQKRIESLKEKMERKK